MWSLRRPTAEQLARLHAGLSALALSYPEHGMSRTATQQPHGYGRELHHAELDVDFERACEALLEFGTHRLPYLFVYPFDARVELGRDVLVSARIGPLWSINPCRIVYVDRADARLSYGYGTLPGHAERGEEAFTVERLPGGRVRAETLAYARPDELIARLGAPIAHVVQRRIKVDYMKALVSQASRG